MHTLTSLLTTGLLALTPLTATAATATEVVVVDRAQFVVPAGARAVVTGVLQQVTAQGTKVPAGPGKTVNARATGINYLNTEVQRSAVTDVYGRYRISLPLTLSSNVVLWSAGGGSAETVVVMNRLVTAVSYDASPDPFSMSVVTGKAWPAGSVVHWQRAENGTWVSYSNTRSDSGGNFLLREYTYDVGPQRWRVILPSNGPESLSQVQFDRIVRRTTTLTGTAGGTNTTVIGPGTKMSTFGHLKIRQYDATVAYGGQQVLVQTRPRGATTTPYTTVATATSSASTGYYYANWTASVDVDIRAAFISTNADVESTWKYIRALDVI